MKKIFFSILFIILLCNTVNASTISITDNTKDENSKKIILFVDGEYAQQLNYSFYNETPYTLINNTNVTFVLQDSYIDIISNSNFIRNLFRDYGNLVLSLILIAIFLGLLRYIYKKTGGY